MIIKRNTILGLFAAILAGTIFFAAAIEVRADASKLELDLAKACEKVAKEHETLAKWADKAKLWRLGFVEWSDVVEFNSEDKEARKRLGYEKTSTGQWVRSRDIEVLKVDEIEEEQRIPLEDEYEVRRLKVKDKALKEFEKILADAFKADDKVIIERAAKLIRRYDPYHKGAIAALGMEVGKDGRPVEPDRPTEADPSVPQPPAENPDGTPAPVGRGSPRTIELPVWNAPGTELPWAQASTIKLRWLESKHFALVSSEMEPTRMEEILAVCEQARTRFYTRYLIPNDIEFFGKKLALLYLADKEEYLKWIDNVIAKELDSERDLDFLRNQAGGSTYDKHFAAYSHSKGEASEKDWAVHYSTHLITGLINGGLPTWMNEAVAYEQSIGLMATSWTSCINDEATGDREKKWADPVNWRELVRNMVKLGEDTPLTSIVTFKPNEIDPKIAAKCWSFLTWLLDTQGEMVYNFLGSLGGDLPNQERAFEAFFGKSMDEVDKDWQRYVKANY